MSAARSVRDKNGRCIQDLVSSSMNRNSNISRSVFRERLHVSLTDFTEMSLVFNLASLKSGELQGRIFVTQLHRPH